MEIADTLYYTISLDMQNGVHVLQYLPAFIILREEHKTISMMHVTLQAIEVLQRERTEQK